jgi:hypothetical protein
MQTWKITYQYFHPNNPAKDRTGTWETRAPDTATARHNFYGEAGRLGVGILDISV